MAHIERSALVMYSAEQMFDLIHDVSRYPEFLPWCKAAHVVSDSDDELVAGMTISKGGLQQTFTTRNQKCRPEWMTLTLEDGPFKTLNGIFRFQALADDACKVTFELDFEVAGKVLSMALTPILKQAANTMVDTFVQRADAVYASQI